MHRLSASTTAFSSGFLYFNPMLEKGGVPASALKGRALREFTKSRGTIEVDPRIYIKDGVAQAWSFLDYRKAESFYYNSRPINPRYWRRPTKRNWLSC